MYVASLGTSLVEARKKLQEISKRSSKKRSRREVGKDNKDIYVTAKLLGDYNGVIFKVGDGKVVSGYTNKRLTKKHFYAFSVESCVLDEDLVRLRGFIFLFHVATGNDVFNYLEACQHCCGFVY